ncbi:MAG: class I SAM-dependent methyltransferase [Candidatus Hermodarchaeota archaeon]
MKLAVQRSSLYNFLRFAMRNPSEKKILDCGAGGRTPPLALFYSYGFECYGIDNSKEQIELAKKYCKEANIELNIKYGDMRDIPFEDEYFGFVYSIFSSVHLSKKDTGIAVKEMERVLKKGGLCYINFLSVEDRYYEKEKEETPGEIFENEGESLILHSYYFDDEPDMYFKDTEIIYKEKRKILIRTDVPNYRTCYLDYITKKK